MIPVVNKWRDNAELMLRVFTELLPAAGLWLPDDPVLDPTYNEGKWWTDFVPPVFEYHTRLTEPEWDYRIMPYAADQFGAIAYDPPYAAQGGRDTSTIDEMLHRFGNKDTPERPQDLLAMNIAGLAECCRVAERVVLMKSMNFTTGAELHRHTKHLETVAEMLGWAVYEQLVHQPTGGRPQPTKNPDGSDRAEMRARQRPSTLTVLVPYKMRKGIAKRRVKAHLLPLDVGRTASTNVA